MVDDHWATVGSSNIDPYSLLMAREANVFVRDPQFADQLRVELLQMIETGARPRRAASTGRGARASPRRLTWIAYGIVRVGMGVLRLRRRRVVSRPRARTAERGQTVAL